MRRLLATAIIAATAAAFCAATVSSAEARKRGKKRYYAQKERPLTIRKRSFLDGGRHPLPGHEHRYVEMDTVHGRLPVWHQGDRFGANVLPGPMGPFGPR